MNVNVYFMGKGLFIEKKFVETLKKELVNEFGELLKDKYVHLDTLMCKIEKGYSYFRVCERSEDLDRLIKVLSNVSKKYELHLSCTLSKDDERDLVTYIREQTKTEDITVRATINV